MSTTPIPKSSGIVFIWLISQSRGTNPSHFVLAFKLPRSSLTAQRASTKRTAQGASHRAPRSTSARRYGSTHTPVPPPPLPYPCCCLGCCMEILTPTHAGMGCDPLAAGAGGVGCSGGMRCAPGSTARSKSGTDHGTGSQSLGLDTAPGTQHMVTPTRRGRCTTPHGLALTRAHVA